VELLHAIETAPFCAWVRESNSLWAYPGILFLHTLTMALVVGISLMIPFACSGSRHACRWLRWTASSR